MQVVHVELVILHILLVYFDVRVFIVLGREDGQDFVDRKS